MIRIYLSRLLGDRKMTQAELARKTKIRPNTINDLYNELTKHISLKNIEKICEVLNCEISDLIEYIPEKNVKDSIEKKIKRDL